MHRIIEFSTTVSKAHWICISMALYIYSKADYAIPWLARAWMLITLTKLDFQFQVLISLYQNTVTVIIVLLIRTAETMNYSLLLEQPLWMSEFPLNRCPWFFIPNPCHKIRCYKLWKNPKNFLCKSLEAGLNGNEKGNWPEKDPFEGLWAQCHLCIREETAAFANPSSTPDSVL